MFTGIRAHTTFASAGIAFMLAAALFLPTGIAAQSVTVVPVTGDFDGDRHADPTLFRGTLPMASWYTLNSSAGYASSSTRSWGVSTDKAVPGDYDGDGKTDIAVFRPSTGQWFISKSSTNDTTYSIVAWGLSTDIPVPADYDGDGKTDIAVFRPSTGQWFISKSSTNDTTYSMVAWGLSTDIPVPADYDGDGKSDIAVFRPSTGQWFISKSSTNDTTSLMVAWGLSTDIPVPADYDGDGKTDLAVFRPSTGQWFISMSSTNYTTYSVFSWGVSTDIPAPGDYDGDGKRDIAVYRPSTGQWLILYSSTNYTTSTTVSAGPAISAVTASSITTSGATISWTTDTASDSQVEYGLTTAYGTSSALNASPVTAHAVPVSGLGGGTLYHFRVRSRDAASNLAISGDFTVTTLDGTAPTVSISAPVAGATVSGPVTVTAAASDNVGVVGVQFKVDGAALGVEDTTAPYGAAWDTTTATNGSHTLTAVARDAAGNTTTSSAVSVTVNNDTTPPVISAVVVTSITASGATITWTTDETSDTQVDYGLTTSYGSSTTLNTSLVTSHTVALNGMGQGTHYNCRVRSRDAAGNLATSTNCTFTTLDTTPPSVSITAPGSGATVSGPVTVSANASDNVGVVGVQFKLDGAPLGTEDLTSPYSVSWDSTTATNGSHTLTAVARDAAANSTTSAGITVTVANDTTPPVISAVTAASITSAGATITWTTNEASDSQVDYGLTTAYGSTSALNAALVTAHSMTVSGLAASTPYHYRVRSRDAASNLATSADFTFMTLAAADTTPPTVSVTAPAAGATVSGPVTVTATASDNVGVAGVQFKVDGVNLGAEDTTGPYSIAWNTLGSADLIFAVSKVIVGPMTINAGTGFTKRLSVSCAGCSGDETVSEDKVQTTAGAAAATFTFSTATHYMAQMAAFKATGTPAYTQGAVATTNAGSSTMALAFGANATAGNLIVAAIAWQGNGTMSMTDSQGNVYSVATASYDAANGQSLGIVYAANVKAGPTTLTASFGGAAPTLQRLEIHEYTGIATANPLDATAVNNADGTTTADAVTSGSAATTVIPPASNGSHTLTAQARDAAGNTAMSAAVTVTVGNGDTTPPVISGVTASSITASAGTISWTTDEASDSQVDYGLTTAYGNSSALNASLVTSHTVALSGLAGATVYHYRVRSRDAAGNLALSTDRTFTTLDGAAPSVSVTAPAAGATVSATVTVMANASDNVGVFGVQFQLDGAPLGAEDTVGPYSVAWDTTTALAGTHTLTAVARDAAGNRTTSAAVLVTVSNVSTPITLVWDPNTEPNLAGYKVYVGTASGVYSTPIDVGNVTSYVVPGLTQGTLYYFVVTAYDLSSNESGRSNEVSAIR